MHDITNKPGVLTENALHVKMMLFEAAEIWCFTRTVSLAYGSFVPEDEVWLLYVNLHKIMNIIFALSIEKSELQALEVLIAEYLEMRWQLFPEENHKQHHLTHNPRLVLEVGPSYTYKVCLEEDDTIIDDNVLLELNDKRLMFLCHGQHWCAGKFSHVPERTNMANVFMSFTHTSWAVANSNGIIFQYVCQTYDLMVQFCNATNCNSFIIE
jgi:hypothetical protein